MSVFPSLDRSTCSGTPKAVAILFATNSCTPLYVPHSYRLIVATDTPAFSANCSCVIFWAILHLLMLSENTLIISALSDNDGLISFCLESVKREQSAPFFSNPNKRLVDTVAGGDIIKANCSMLQLIHMNLLHTHHPLRNEIAFIIMTTSDDNSKTAIISALAFFIL